MVSKLAAGIGTETMASRGRMVPELAAGIDLDPDLGARGRMVLRLSIDINPGSDHRALSRMAREQEWEGGLKPSEICVGVLLL